MTDISKATDIRGWMSEGELYWLADQASQCELMVEIGTFLGRSARAVGDHCHGILYCVDPYSKEVDPGYENQDQADLNYKTVQWNLKDLMVTGRLVLLRKTSVEGFGWLADKWGLDKFDFVFIDGDHRYDAVKQDIELYSQLVKPGGWLAGHDYYTDGVTHQGVRQAVDELFSNRFERVVGSIWRVQQ